MRKRSHDLLSREEIRQFQRTLLKWYEQNKRDLPWRHPSLQLRNGLRDPYHILISEVMLQQTQVGRVISKYKEWMEVFPTIESLAMANTRDILLHWSGLGYNRRALYLQRAAQELIRSSSLRGAKRQSNLLVQTSSSQSSPKRRGRVRSHTLYWPQTEQELRKLPGIGEYTAKALLCFAFNKQVAVVDTNIRKVILVHFPDLTRGLNTKEEQKMVEQIARQLLPTGKAYEWNQALMDYAAAELKAHKIPIKKQSTFKDSDRYYRGLTLKLLLKKDKQTFESLLRKVLAHNKVERERYKKILLQLEKEKLVTCRKGVFYLGETNDD